MPQDGRKVRGSYLSTGRIEGRGRIVESEGLPTELLELAGSVELNGVDVAGDVPLADDGVRLDDRLECEYAAPGLGVEHFLLVVVGVECVDGEERADRADAHCESDQGGRSAARWFLLCHCVLLS